MNIVVLQPGYLPWLGFFDLMGLSDVFVVYDDVQYTKNDWRNRNRIKTPQGIRWLTVPVDDKKRITQHLLIKDVKIKNKIPWQDRHLKAIELNYKRARFYSDYFFQFEEIYKKKMERLIDLNTALVFLICKLLDLKRKIVFSSELGIDGVSTDRIIKICKYFNGKRYISGKVAMNYLDENMFREAGICLTWHEYQHPVYDQLWDKFIPYLSVIDVLFNCGRESMKIINSGSLIQRGV